LIAVASVSGMMLAWKASFIAHVFVERRRARGLDHGERGRRSMKPGRAFAQAFAECGDVAEIAAGEHDPVGHFPVALVHHFDDDGFLAFDAEGIDRVQQIDAEALGQTRTSARI
jgi:hypothetical protein